MTENERNPATDQEPAPAGTAERDDPGAPPEEAGLPEYADDESPANRWLDDPQRQPMPVDEPVALDDYGLTGEEERRGEPLSGRLARELPDVGEEEEMLGPSPDEVTIRKDTGERDPGDPDEDLPGDPPRA